MASCYRHKTSGVRFTSLSIGMCRCLLFLAKVSITGCVLHNEWNIAVKGFFSQVLSQISPLEIALKYTKVYNCTPICILKVLSEGYVSVNLIYTFYSIYFLCLRTVYFQIHGMIKNPPL